MAESQEEVVVFHRGQQDSDSDIWNDTALIKAYDNAVNIMKSRIAEDPKSEDESKEEQSDKKKKNKRKNKKGNKRKRQWKVGDHCRAVFSEDGLVYEAEILSINGSAGTCFVRYAGYGNEEEHSLSDLMLLTNQAGKHKTMSDVESDTMDWAGRSPRPHTHTAQAHPATPSANWHIPPYMNGAFPMFPGQQQTFPFPGIPSFPSFSGHHPGASAPRMPTVPPPPPPLTEDILDGDSEALCSMLMAWYMSGYHTGYYQGIRHGRQHSASSSRASSTKR